jgi:hypothetical protein
VPQLLPGLEKEGQVGGKIALSVVIREKPDNHTSTLRPTCQSFRSQFLTNFERDCLAIHLHGGLTLDS